MQRCEPFSPPFLPLSCAEVACAAASEEEWCGAATWVGIVVGDSPCFYAALVTAAEAQQRPVPSHFTVRLPMTELPDGMKLRDRLAKDDGTVRIQCRASTSRQEHDRLLICGDITTIQMEETSNSWLSSVLRAVRSARPHLPQTAANG